MCVYVRACVFAGRRQAQSVCGPPAAGGTASVGAWRAGAVQGAGAGWAAGVGEDISAMRGDGTWLCALVCKL